MVDFVIFTLYNESMEQRKESMIMSKKEMEKLFRRIERASGVTMHVWFNRMCTVCRGFFL